MKTPLKLVSQMLSEIRQDIPDHSATGNHIDRALLELTAAIHIQEADAYSRIRIGVKK